jgi:hypothetical protein
MQKAEVRDTFTVVYRGYYIEVSRGCIGWRARVIPEALICPFCIATKYRLPIKTRR